MTAVFNPASPVSASSEDAACYSPPTSSTPAITLIAPNGGQSLDPGSVYSITWSAVNASSVRLSLSLDGGLNYPVVIAEAAPGIIYNWTVNDYATKQARIKVEALDACGYPVASDVSDGDFSLNGSQVWTPSSTESSGGSGAAQEDLTVVIKVSTPVPNAVVSGTVLIQAQTDAAVSGLTFELVASGASVPTAVKAIGDDKGRTWTGFWDSTKGGNGAFSLTAAAVNAAGQTVGRSVTVGLTVKNLVLSTIKVAVTEPASGTGVKDLVQLSALTDKEADALDFVIRPKSDDVSAEPAVSYGLTGSNRLLWTTSFDTRKYANGPYYVKAKVYLSGTVVGESKDIEVLFDNPAATAGADVSLSLPAEGATATGTVALVARTAAAAGAVDFVITADSAAGGEAEPVIVKAVPDLEKKKWTALWESFGVENGSYGLKAKAYNDGRLAGESPLRALQVYNELMLVAVDLTSPRSGDSVSGQLILRATTEVTLEKVEFLVKANDALAAAPPIEIQAAPSQGNLEWSAAWDTAQDIDGRYQIWARAWYQGRSVGDSPIATVTVANAAAAGSVSGGLNLAETLAPETDPGQTGEYSREQALGDTPTINLDRGLMAVPETAGGLLMVPGTLFKSPEAAAVYYYGRDGKRYVFPESRTYFTWYSNFNNVRTVSAATVAAIGLGGNVTYRPGSRMVKISSDPKVYAVARGGVLRWVQDEVVARRLYGTNWNKSIDDVSDAFFFNYQIGNPIGE